MNYQSPYFREIMNDPQNTVYTAKDWHPIYSVDPRATILIIGQAPGKRVQDTEVMWNDASGDRLQDWLGISRKTFYESGKIAVIPMDFYYLGKGKSGDVPPRKNAADKWHPKLLVTMPNIKLTVLIDAYAQRYYLKQPANAKITDLVKNYQQFLPCFFPIVQPSPRNKWFEMDVVPALRQQVSDKL